MGKQQIGLNTRKPIKQEFVEFDNPAIGQALTKRNDSVKESEAAITRIDGLLKSLYVFYRYCFFRLVLLAAKRSMHFGWYRTLHDITSTLVTTNVVLDSFNALWATEIDS